MCRVQWYSTTSGRVVESSRWATKRKRRESNEAYVTNSEFLRSRLPLTLDIHTTDARIGCQEKVSKYQTCDCTGKEWEGSFDVVSWGWIQGIFDLLRIGRSDLSTDLDRRSVYRRHGEVRKFTLLITFLHISNHTQKQSEKNTLHDSIWRVYVRIFVIWCCTSNLCAS